VLPTRRRPTPDFSPAAKALAAGYSDVDVMPQGVMGWKESGHQTEKVL